MNRHTSPGGRGAAAALFAGALLGLSGCGLGQFQTARTLPKGHVTMTAAAGFVGNETLKERRVNPYNFPPHLEARVGVGDRVDVGAALFMGAGLGVDAKVNLLPPDHPLAVAVRAGFGAAADLGTVDQDGRSAILHLPVTVLASYTFVCPRTPCRITPYLGAGYSFFWIFGRPTASGGDVARGGYGDGLLRLTAGLEYETARGFALLVEYSYLPPVVDDPGDGFSFVASHMAGIGFRWRLRWPRA